jgi:hypothetical protein
MKGMRGMVAETLPIPLIPFNPLIPDTYAYPITITMWHPVPARTKRCQMKCA